MAGFRLFKFLQTGVNKADLFGTLKLGNIPGITLAHPAFGRFFFFNEHLKDFHLVAKSLFTVPSASPILLLINLKLLLASVSSVRGG